MHPTEAESTVIGDGVEPGAAGVGSTAWAIYSAVRALKANGEDPMKAAERRKMVHSFEIAKDKTICPDYISDCFTHAEPQKLLGVQKPVGSVLWAVELLVREVCVSGEVPKLAKARKTRVQGFEVLQGRKIDGDFITDCFTDAETSGSGEFVSESRDAPRPVLNVDNLEIPRPRNRMPFSRTSASQIVSTHSSTRIDHSVCCTATCIEAKAILLTFWSRRTSKLACVPISARQRTKTWYATIHDFSFLSQYKTHSHALTRLPPEYPFPRKSFRI
jgi:hypothetical protein